MKGYLAPNLIRYCSVLADRAAPSAFGQRQRTPGPSQDAGRVVGLPGLAVDRFFWHHERQRPIEAAQLNRSVDGSLGCKQSKLESVA
jgi:hypothetical protein